MQLNKSTLAVQLGAAVLGALSSVHAAETLVETSVLGYSESDSQQSRINVVEPMVKLTRIVSPDESYSVQIAADTLSGASPNGAVSANQPQTFTSASGKKTYDVKPNTLPLDPHFYDQRQALSLNMMRPIHETLRYSLGGHYSQETDWRSLGVNGTLLKDMNNKQTTLSFGLGVTLDGISPFKLPKPGSLYSANQTLDSSAGSLGDEQRTTYEMLLGVTHTLNRKNLISLNYALSQSNGYHTDPYKIVSILDAQGAPTDYAWESRPDSRTRQSLSLGWIGAFGEDALHVNYRYYWDDWAVTSHTIDVRYHWAFASDWELAPHLRYSTQTAADFYQVALADGQAIPQQLSSDYRLADLTGLTYGAKLSKTFGDHKLSLGLEQFVQKASGDTGLLTPQQADQVYPEISATMVTLGYRYRF